MDVIRAARQNVVLSALGIGVSAIATVVVVRALGPALFAEYALVTAIVAFGFLFADAGSSLGFMRHLPDAMRAGSAATLYRRVLRGRALGSLLAAGVLAAGGPLWVKHTELSQASWSSWLFAAIGVLLFFQMASALSFYALLGFFRHGEALAAQQIVRIVKAAAIAGVALVYKSIVLILAVMIVMTALEALTLHRRAWRRLVGQDRQPPAEMHRGIRRYGAASLFDKLTSMIGSGPFLLIVLAGVYGRLELALLALAADLLQKGLNVTGMPVASMVRPYLNRDAGDEALLGDAVRRSAVLSALIFMGAAGLFAVLLPNGVPLIFGSIYAPAAALALWMLVPVFLDSWTRVTLVSALLTKGLYRTVVRVNAVQALAALLALALTFERGLTAVVIGQGIAKLAVALLVVQVSARHGLYQPAWIPRRLWLTTWAALAVGFAVQWLTPAAGLIDLATGATAYAAAFAAGLRGWVRIGPDLTARLHALAGRHQRIAQFLFPTTAA